MEKIRVRVTKTDIKNGLRFRSAHCPIALATKRKLNNQSVLVSPSGIHIRAFPVEISNLKKIQKFVNDFDNSRYVAPFSFTLYL